MTTRNGVAYTYGSSKPHAVTQVGATGYTYDDNGSMTVRGGQTLTWDVENRPIQVTEGADTWTFVYDGDGKRVKKNGGGETTVYVNRYHEVNVTTGEATRYYYLGGLLVALNKDGELEFLHREHLVGTVVSTTCACTFKSLIKYLPFGQTWSEIDTLGTDVKFTGQRLDATG